MDRIHKTVYDRFRRACPQLACALYDPGLRLNTATSPLFPKKCAPSQEISMDSDGTCTVYVPLSDGWLLHLCAENKTKQEMERLRHLVLSIQQLVQQNQQLAAELSSNQDKMSLLLNRLFSLSTSDDIAYTAIAAVSMGYDMTLPRVICLFRLRSMPEDENLSESILQAISSLIQNHSKMTDQDLIGKINSNQIVLCKTVPADITSIQQHFHPFLSSICASIMELYPVSVQVGVGEICHSFSDYSSEFLEINQVMRCEALLGNPKSFFYTCDKQFELEMLRLPLAKSIHLLGEKLEILERSPQFLQTIEALLTHNMSIRDAAEHLFVHHNTVVFRINRIKELLGIDPLQKNRDLALLTMLFMHSKLKPLMSPDSKGYIPQNPELTID